MPQDIDDDTYDLQFGEGHMESRVARDYIRPVRRSVVGQQVESRCHGSSGYSRGRIYLPCQP